ncbi:MAG TPA: porin [Polyangia bacterium]|nr:porin [Polyangia bacterium]
MRSKLMSKSFPKLVTIAALAVSLTSAARAETWPPTTPPRVDLGPAPKGSSAPAPVTPIPPPPAAVAPPAAAASTPPTTDVAPPSVPVEAPPVVAAPPPAVEPSESASSVSTVSVVAAPPAPVRERYGSRDGQLFVRTPGDGVVLLPVARLELDGRGVETGEQNASQGTFSLGRARLDLAGWLGSPVYFDAGVDFANGPSLRHTDDFVAVAPWGDRAILQLGQFDAPFTLENRTPDRYLDLGDRGAAVHTFAIPDNKDQGVMLHGTNPERNFYYSAAVMNGEGPRATGVDGRVDVMARGWIAPFSFRDPRGLRDLRVGASVWTGDRSFQSSSSTFTGQTTAAGFSVLDPTAWRSDGRNLELRQDGRLAALGIEVDAPFANRFGGRFELVWKRQPLAAVDPASATTPAARAGGLTLSGFGAYVEGYAWILGDASLLGSPAAAGLGLPTRLRDFQPTKPRSGLMVSARLDFIDEKLAADAESRTAKLNFASEGDTRVTAATVGASYWYTRRARALLTYTFNKLDGANPYFNGLDSKNVQEVLLRTAFAL